MENVKSKSILAKLLATENITVEHRKVPTAYFMPKERIMVLPTWKDMSGNLYDLLLGHEVGHALNTPAQGWHNAVTDESKKGFKSYLNVVEDARIERAIQEKFPGLKPSFRRGYQELMDNDFFGVKENNYVIEMLPLIDRINLHFKIGSYLNLQFDDKEQVFVDKVYNVKTWEDVVRVATELYEYGKEEAKLKTHDSIEYEGFLSDDDLDQSDIDSDDVNLSDMELDPESLTDSAFRQKESSLLDNTVAPYVYVNLPEARLDKIIVPYKRMALFHNAFRNGSSSQDTDAMVSSAKEALYKQFYAENKRYISYLIKEFELKRNADQLARASIAKTGQLDIKKVHSYKFKDDLFKKISVVPHGKSHGLVMFIDYSGSMSGNMHSTIEQTILLAIFCRKVNIPFRVYAFTDLRSDAKSFAEEHGFDPDDSLSAKKFFGERKFGREDRDIELESASFRLREYLSNEMSSVEFKEAVKFWLLAGVLHGRKGWCSISNNPKYANIVPQELLNPPSEELNGTPLNEAVAAAIPLVREFRKAYRLDIVNTVFLTDGDSNDNYRMWQGGVAQTFAGRWATNYNLVIRDKKTMIEGKAPPNTEITVAFLNLLKNSTGVNVIGFHISDLSRRTILHRCDKGGASIGDVDEQIKEARKKKFFMLNNIGYDDYYMIPGGDDLEVKEDVMDPTAKTKNELKRAFLKMQKSKSVNRILLSRFIDKIA